MRRYGAHPELGWLANGMLQRLLKGVGANALGQLVLIILQLSMVPVFALHWGLELYGLWLMLATVPTYLGFSDLGFGKAACVDMTMAIGLNDEKRAVAVFQSASIMIVVSALALLLATVALALLIPGEWLGTAAPVADARLALILLMCYGITALSGTIASGPLQSMGGYHIEALCMSFAWALEGGAAIAAVLAGYGIVMAAAAYLIARIISMSILFAFARRVAPWARFGIQHASWMEIKRLFPPAAAMMLNPLANSLVLQGTALAVGAGAGSAAVPAFTTTRTLSRVAMQVTGILVRSTMPDFSVATAREDRANQRMFVLAAVMFSAVLLLPMALVMFVGGVDLVSGWTRGVVHVSYGLMIVMTLVLLANGFWVPLSNLVIATNRQSMFTYPFITLAIISIVISYILSQYFGALGGALAMLFVDVTMALVLARTVVKLFGPRREIFAMVPELRLHVTAILRTMSMRLKRTR